MDPEVPWRALHAMTARIEAISSDPDGDWHAELIEALEHFEALDTHLARGGFRPAAWQPRP